MLKKVLPVRGTVFHFTDHSKEFMMQVVNTQVDANPFSDFIDLLLKLFFCFGNNFFDTCRMNPPVGDQFVQRKPRDFTPYRIES